MNHAVHSVRILMVALVVPLLITLAALAVTFSIASTLPSSVAVHWNAAGVPDGFGSPFTFPILIAVICLPLDAIFGSIAVLSAHRAPVTVMTKILATVGVFVSVLLAVALGGATVLEHGAASQAHASLVSLPVGFGAAAVLSVVAWFLLPKAVKVPRGGGTSVAPVPLGAEERASWIRSATAPAWLTWSVVGFMVVISGVVLFSVLERGGGIWPISCIPVVIFLLVLSNFAWTIRVDARGVRMRSSLGIPRITVPLANIESAEVIEVQALAQYGGFGVRFGLNGRFGVILRSGEALEILRHSGRSVVVTVDDATSAAALINGLVKRSSVALP
jgi:hypothetical protein